MFDVLKNAFVLALGRMLGQVFILLPAFDLEWPLREPRPDHDGVLFAGMTVCHELTLSRTEGDRGHEASSSSCQKAVRLPKASKALVRAFLTSSEYRSGHGDFDDQVLPSRPSSLVPCFSHVRT